MTQPTESNERSQTERLRAWLKTDVTVTLPGWAVAVCGFAAVILLLVALD